MSERLLEGDLRHLAEVCPNILDVYKFGGSDGLVFSASGNYLTVEQLQFIDRLQRGENPPFPTHHQTVE